MPTTTKESSVISYRLSVIRLTTTGPPRYHGGGQLATHPLTTDN